MKIVNIAANNPIFIELQYKTLKKLLILIMNTLFLMMGKIGQM